MPDFISEEVQVELWNLQFLTGLGFGGEACSLLLQWGTDPHAASDLLFRDGVATSCTHEQALRILRPLEDRVLIPLVEQAEQYSVRV